MKRITSFGTIAVVHDDAHAEIPAGQQTHLMARLLVDANRIVSKDRLMDTLYGTDNSGALKTLVATVRNRHLAKVCDDPKRMIADQGNGYRLNVEGWAFDVREFEELEQSARRLLRRREGERALVDLERAKRIYDVGAAFAGVDLEGVSDEVLRLTALREQVDVAWYEARLAIDDYGAITAGLVADFVEVSENRGVLHERKMELYITALHASGQAHEADRVELGLRTAAVDQGHIFSEDFDMFLNQSLQRNLRARHARIPMPMSILRESSAAPRQPPHGSRVETDQVMKRFVPRKLIGRGPEIAELIEVFDRCLGAVDDESTVSSATPSLEFVLIEGEPGIGKSRLAREFAILAEAKGATILHGRTDPDFSISFGPFVEMLRFARRSREDPSKRFATSGEDDEAGQLLEELSHPRSRDYPSDSDNRLRLFEALQGWIQATSDVRPLVIVIDDLHRADRSTLDALRYIVTTSVASRVMVVATAQPARALRGHHLALGTDGDVGGSQGRDYTQAIAAFDRSPGFHRVELGDLAPEAVEEYISIFEADGRTDRGTWVRRHASRLATSGNPFLISAMLRSASVVDRAEYDTSPTTEPEGGQPGDLLSEEIREHTERRIEDSMSASGTERDLEIRTLQHAALLGGTFDTVTLSRVLNEKPEALDRVLSRLADRGLFSKTSGTKWRFSHALVVQAILESRSEPWRDWQGSLGEVHARIAEVLERTSNNPARTPYDQISWHQFEAARNLDSSELAEQAMVTAREGAAQASKAHRYAEAVALHLRRKTILLSGLLQRQTPPAEELCATLIDLGIVLRRAGSPDYYDVLLDACILAEGERDPFADESGTRDGPGSSPRIAYPGLLADAALENTRGVFSSPGSDRSILRAGWLTRALSAPEISSATRLQLEARLRMERFYFNDRNRAFEEATALKDDALNRWRAHRDATHRSGGAASGHASAADEGDPSDGIGPTEVLRILNDYHWFAWRPDAPKQRTELIEEMEEVLGDTDIEDHGNWQWAVESFSFQLAVEQRRINNATLHLENLAQLSDAIRQPALVYWTTIHAAVPAVLAGDLRRCAELANSGYVEATAVGFEDADLFRLGRLWMTEYHRSDLGKLKAAFEMYLPWSEILPVVPAALASIATEVAWTAEAAPADEVGDTSQALQAAAEILLNIPEATWDRPDQDQLSAIAAFSIARAGIDIDDLRAAADGISPQPNPDPAAHLYETLERHQDTFIDNGTSFHGSAHHYLALLKDAIGRALDDPVEAATEFAKCDEHFRSAVAAHRAIDPPSPTFLGNSLVEWACSLAGRGEADLAAPLIDECTAIAEAHPQLRRLQSRLEYVRHKTPH